MNIAIGADHAGYRLKDKIAVWLKTASGGKHHVQDMGTHGPDSVDYPDYAAFVAKAVARKSASKGILFCGTGIGMAIAANKIHGIRAAVIWNETTATLAAAHNEANIICLPGRMIRTKKAQAMIRAFLRTPFGGGRHARRIRKISRLDRCA